MRKFIDLIEATLYRGDAQEIESYDIDKTGDWGFALFGKGIYLTDVPEIAADYTVNKGARDQVVASGDYKTQRDAIAGLLMDILNKELKWPQESQDIKDDWQSRWWSMDKDTMTNEEFHQQYRDALLAAYKKRLQEAKKLYKERAPGYRFTTDTAGRVSIVIANRPGRVSRFEIPDDYLKKCLHGDEPLSDDAVKVIGEFIEGKRPGWSDFRDRNNERVQGKDGKHNFWAWVEEFKTGGSEYAWRDGPERRMGGAGLNPSLDQIWHGQHGGYDIFNQRDESTFIPFMQSKGYVGIEYHGGVRVGDNVRGGGGVRHNSYVLWDDAYVNQCRVEQTAVADPELDYDPKKLQAKTLYTKHKYPER